MSAPQRPHQLPDAATRLRVDVLPAAPLADGETLRALLRETQNRLLAAERLIGEQEKKIRELEDIASTDVLTHLMNRRGFENFYAQECARIGRGQSTGALLVLIDLDGFKAINDTYGHQAGDACLKVVAEQLMHAIRFTDGAARFGGDEFALLLTQTDLDKAADRAIEIRAALDAISFDWQGTRLSCTGSIGIAPVTRGDEDLALPYRRADAALYADKHRRKAAE